MILTGASFGVLRLVIGRHLRATGRLEREDTAAERKHFISLGDVSCCRRVAASATLTSRLGLWRWFACCGSFLLQRSRSDRALRRCACGKGKRHRESQCRESALGADVAAVMVSARLQTDVKRGSMMLRFRSCSCVVDAHLTMRRLRGAGPEHAIEDGEPAGAGRDQGAVEAGGGMEPRRHRLLRRRVQEFA